MKYETRSNSNKWRIKGKSIGTASEPKLGALTRFRGMEREVKWEIMITPIRAQHCHFHAVCCFAVRLNRILRDKIRNSSGLIIVLISVIRQKRGINSQRCH